MKTMEELQQILLEQIKVRRELINQMVGDLYPRILLGELEKLRAMLELV